MPIKIIEQISTERSLRRQFDRSMEKRRKILQCVMVPADFADDPRVDGRDGWVWVREYGKTTSDVGEVFQVFNPSVERRVNLPVLVGHAPKKPYRFQVLDIDWSTMANGANVNNLIIKPMGKHAKTHTFLPGRPNNDWSTDIVNVTTRNLIDGRVYPTNPASMICIVAPFSYIYGTQVNNFAQSYTKDFTADVPGAGLARLEYICVDGSTNALDYVLGSTFGWTSWADPLPPAALPAVPSGYVLVGAVILYNGLTAIVERNFTYDIKPILAATHLFTDDHGALSGLADDDHTQYHTDARHAALNADVHSSGAATDGQVLTADGAGGSAWESAASVDWSAIQSGQLVNEIKGWPPVVNTGDLDALNLWWDKVGTPSTAPSVIAVGDEGITENYELALKVITDGADEGLSQRYTYADEPRLKSGRISSALVAIWSVDGVSVTAALVNSDASATTASAVTAAAWTIVLIENHTLAGTYCDLQVTAADAGTFYVVPLGMNIGSKAWPLPPRPERYVEIATAAVVSAVDPGGAGYTDIDFTASTSPLAKRINLHAAYWNGSTAGTSLYVRRNGNTEDTASQVAVRVYVTAYGTNGMYICACDDGQVLEYKTSGWASDSEQVTIGVTGWWEWA